MFSEKVLRQMEQFHTETTEIKTQRPQRKLYKIVLQYMTTPTEQAVAEKTFSELVLNKIGLNLYSGKFQSHFSHF